MKVAEVITLYGKILYRPTLYSIGPMDHAEHANSMTYPSVKLQVSAALKLRRMQPQLNETSRSVA